MNSENIDIERMRKAWLAMGESLGMQPSPDPDNLNNRKTALDRLRDKYRVFWTVAIVMTFGSFMMFQGALGESEYSFWLRVAFALYFLTAFCMDHWLWRGIGTIHPLRMGVAQVVAKAMYYRKRHLQFMAILIPAAVALLCVTGYAFSSQTYFLNGMVVGALCGLIIGIIQFRRFMAEYRNLSE